MLPLMFTLTCQSGPAKGKRITIEKPSTVGRDATCAIVLDDPKISRVHGSFLHREGQLHFVDNHSTNGSFLNGQKISDVAIRLGDVLRLGSNEFVLFAADDFRTINIIQAEALVTSAVTTDSVKLDKLARKFEVLFESYKKHNPNLTERERNEFLRTQRLLQGLNSIFAISETITKLLPVDELLKQIGVNLFGVFDGAENLVILLLDQEKRDLVIKHAACRDSEKEPAVTISRTVLDRAVEERSTLITNDAAGDSRLSASESIIGFSVKSVMCAPLVAGEKVLGALYLDNRSRNAHYDELDAELLSAFANQCAIAIDNALLSDTLQAVYLQTLQALVNAIEAKDAYTVGHTARVSRYSVGIGSVLGFSAKRLSRLKMAADLHDIGKIGIKEGIINKAGALTDTEYSSIKDHVEMGEKILRPITHLHDILPYIRGHHERWDGTGYPDGLVGEACPLEGRIIALADAFDAMTSQRSYNKPMTFRQAWDRINGAKGKHFDPYVADGFYKYLNETLFPEETARNPQIGPLVAVADPKTNP
jgi:HD-GYP domain-containing protein (c-di-GMP phosphodiesterase class II)